MKLLLRQDGYTLLLTLVIVVLLFLLTASFSIASMNQTKQIEKTDDSFLATSIAEMGVEYYKDSLESKLATLYSKALFEVNKIKNDSTKTADQKNTAITAKISEYNTLIQTEITTFLNTESASNYSRSVDTSSRAYKIQSYTKEEVTAPTGYVNVVLDVKVAGLINQTVKKSIDMKMSYPKLSVPLVNGLPTLPTLTFQEYAEKYKTDSTLVTTLQTPNIPNDGYEFQQNTFYYFPNNIEFDTQQFNQNSNKDLGNIFVYAAEGVFFLKHVRIDGSQLRLNKISFTFSSNAKSDIISSLVVTDTIDFSVEVKNNGNVANVSETDKRVNLDNSDVCIVNPITNTKFTDVKAAFKHSNSKNGYQVVYRLNSDATEKWYVMDATNDKKSITIEQKDAICTLTMQDPNGIIDPGTSVDEIKYN